METVLQRVGIEPIRAMDQLSKLGSLFVFPPFSFFLFLSVH
jgi:hypothetical protein